MLYRLGNAPTTGFRGTPRKKTNVFPSGNASRSPQPPITICIDDTEGKVAGPGGGAGLDRTRRRAILASPAASEAFGGHAPGERPCAIAAIPGKEHRTDGGSASGAQLPGGDASRRDSGIRLVHPSPRRRAFLRLSGPGNE